MTDPTFYEKWDLVTFDTPEYDERFKVTRKDVEKMKSNDLQNKQKLDWIKKDLKFNRDFRRPHPLEVWFLIIIYIYIYIIKIFVYLKIYT